MTDPNGFEPSYWALVVGINRYQPAMGSLEGAENDAKEFYEWVTSPAGGKVRPGQAPWQCKLILSDPGPHTFAPTIVEIEDWLNDILNHVGLDQKAGKRLYIYFSGHGFTPSIIQPEAALLVANATPAVLKWHVPGRIWAQLLLNAGYFDEVLYFMDCCRNTMQREVPLNLPGIPLRLGPNAGSQRFMHAFAAAFPKLAREKTFDGARRGVFTRTLLAGLRGGAAVPAAQGVGSVVTSASLEGFLKDNMKRYFSAEELANPDLADEPVVDRGSAVITIAEFPQLPVFPVQVDLVPGETGAPLKLFDASSRELPGVPGQVPASNGASAPSLSLQLPRGLYRLEVGARQLLFEVWGLRDQGALGGPNAGNQ